MSPWEPESDINRINNGRIGEWHSIAPQFRDVLACGLDVHHATDGAFDVALGRVVELWGFGVAGVSPRSLDPESIARAHRLSGSQWIELDAGNCRLRRTADVKLELSGIAKGYAVDLVLEILKRNNILHGLVDIGGELAGIGVKPDGLPWWVGIDGSAKGVSTIVALHDLAIATSGIERSVIVAGNSYSHTIDPRTGAPITHAMISCTVVAACCMYADACATALLVTGPAKAKRLTDRLGVACLIRHRSGQDVIEETSAAFDALLNDAGNH